MNTQNNQPLKLLRGAAVQAKVGLGKTQIRDLESRGLFPKRIKISERASAYLESEVDAWITARIAASRDQKQAA